MTPQTLIFGGLRLLPTLSKAAMSVVMIAIFFMLVADAIATLLERVGQKTSASTYEDRYARHHLQCMNLHFRLPLAFRTLLQPFPLTACPSQV